MIAALVVSLVVELAVTPARVSGDTPLAIRGTVRNVGSSTLDTEIWASTLLINEKPSENWPLAIANGLRDEKEFALPPGERVEFRRVLPSSSLLSAPGRYELVLVVHGVRSAPIVVERY